MKDAVEETEGRPRNDDYTPSQREEEGLEAIKELKEEVLERLNTIYQRFEDYFENLESLKSEVRIIKESEKMRDRELEDFKARIESEKSEEKKSLKHVERNIEKIDEKIDDIMSEVGYGESLDVSKIPPNILEIVYQSTLDDLVTELWKSLGPGDFERVITETLEEVRLMTSGSELFRFDNNRRIRTNNLAKSLAEGLISAKQIQTTYDVLLEKLTQYIPYHKAKNFRAMIKIKSQEYTVDKTTYLLEKVERIEKSLTQTNQLVAALSAQLNAKGMQMERNARDMEKKMYLRYDSAVAEIREELKRLNEEKIGTSEKNELMLTLREIQEGQNRLREELDGMKAMFEMKEGINDAKIEMLVNHLGLQKEAENMEETLTSRKRLSELDEESRFVYYAIPDSEEEAMTAAAISKKLGDLMDKKRVKEKIEELAENSFIFGKKKGKTVRYFRPEGEAPEEEAPTAEKGEEAAEPAGEAELPEKTEAPEAEEKTEAPEKEEKPGKKGEKKKGKKGGRKKGKSRKEKEKKTEEPSEKKQEGETAEKEEKRDEPREVEQGEPEKEEVKSTPPEEEIDTAVLEEIMKILPMEGGLTMARIRGEAKGIKYTDILMGIKTLIDRGEVTAVQSGRRTLYRRITKKKEDKGD